MNRSEHFQRLRETGSVVVPLIREAYSHLASRDPQIGSALSLMVARRTMDNQPLLRPYLVRLAYEVAGGRDWQKIAALCAASEVFNISTYQANAAFDGKLDINGTRERSEQFACAMLSLEIAESMITKLDAPRDAINRILDDLGYTNRELYLGQMMDMCRSEHLTDLDSVSIDRLFEQYELRCRRLGGELTRWCLRSGSLLAGADNGCVELISQIGLHLGIAGQMVNDVGDLVIVPQNDELTSTQRYQDVYSDIRAGKLTHPILVALRQGDVSVLQNVEEIIEDPGLAMESCITLTYQLIESGAFAETRATLLGRLKTIRLLIRQLSRSVPRTYLTLAATTIGYNKYFASIRHLIANSDSEITPD